ncbi:MAG TPA: hypothetical protein VM580_14435 [Labilithrix sp.]|nr:hypothetical protein [Labilithrix sp.]
MSREVRVVVLFEDSAHSKFIRRLVARLKLVPVRFIPCRDSTGVLRAMVDEVNVLREKRHQKNLGLVVVIDADGGGLSGRRKELLALIEKVDGGPRGEDERVALVVPALEIENWYVFLCCPEERPIDETRDYKPSPAWKKLDKDLAAAARKAVDAWTEPGREDPPSLVEARLELGRVS